ncbi:hypothetical protein TeGR_g14730, partial [Tetraparma gracilis]
MWTPQQHVLITLVGLVAIAIGLLTSRLVTFPYTTYPLGPGTIAVSIPITVGLTKCYSPICSLISAGGGDGDWTQFIPAPAADKEGGGGTVQDIMPKFSVVRDPQARPYYFAAILTIVGCAGALVTTLLGVVRAIGGEPGAGEKGALLGFKGAVLMLGSIVLYLAITIKQTMFSLGEGEEAERLHCDYLVGYWVCLAGSVGVAGYSGNVWWGGGGGRYG